MPLKPRRCSAHPRVQLADHLLGVFIESPHEEEAVFRTLIALDCEAPRRSADRAGRASAPTGSSGDGFTGGAGHLGSSALGCTDCLRAQKVDLKGHGMSSTTDVFASQTGTRRD